MVWIAFAAVASLAQWALERAALLTPMMECTSKLLSGALLIAAGLYQWMPLKVKGPRGWAFDMLCRLPLALMARKAGLICLVGKNISGWPSIAATLH